jgi:hypothetical protein
VPAAKSDIEIFVDPNHIHLFDAATGAAL